MRLDRAQFPPVRRFTTPGAFKIDFSRYWLVGYNVVDILCVGAAGGASGTYNKPEHGTDYKSYGAGGGGGAARWRRYSLLDVVSNPVKDVIVGAAGAHGADAGNLLIAPSGGDGGESRIGETMNYAGGGYGARGGGRTFQTGGVWRHLSSKGGNGGESWNDYNSPTFDGRGGDNGIHTDPDGPLTAIVPAQAGIWQTTGLTLPDLGVGTGGGGGAGYFYQTAEYGRGSQHGASGNGASGNQYSPGSTAGWTGGHGGGARELFLTGLDQHYGSYYPAANVSPHGAVILKFS